MAPPGSGIAKTPQQVGRIDRALSMSAASGARSLRANRGNRIGDRGPGKIGFLIHRETRYSH